MFAQYFEYYAIILRGAVFCGHSVCLFVLRFSSLQTAGHSVSKIVYGQTVGVLLCITFPSTLCGCH